MLCVHLEGWDREGGSETQEGGDMVIYVCICISTADLPCYTAESNHCKQLYSNKDVRKI